MATISDFNSYLQSGGSFASVWNGVQSQLQAEGATASDLDAAKTAFVGQYSGLLSNAFGVTGDQAAQMAGQFVTLGQTAAGAASQVAGLVNLTQSGAPPTAIASAFTGTLIGLGVAAGVVLPGVGAAIAAVVAVAIDVIQALVPSPPSYQVCPGYSVSSQPSLVVGCTAWFTKSAQTPVQVTPGSLAWRHFPDASVKAPGTVNSFTVLGSSSDAWWYTAVPFMGDIASSFLWNGFTVLAQDGSKRPIDFAFPPYKQVVEVDAAGKSGDSSIPSDFLKMYASAWKANAEYSLNGLKAQSDDQVLLHCLRLWNRAHSGPTVPFTASKTYVGSLLPLLLSEVSDTDLGVVSNGQVVIATGSVKNTPATPAAQNVINLHFGVGGNVLSASAFGTPMAASAPSAAPLALSAFLPLLPVVGGLLLMPFLGLAGPAIGSAGSVIWWVAQRKS